MIGPGMRDPRQGPARTQFFAQQRGPRNIRRPVLPGPPSRMGMVMGRPGMGRPGMRGDIRGRAWGSARPGAGAQRPASGVGVRQFPGGQADGGIHQGMLNFLQDKMQGVGQGGGVAHSGQQYPGMMPEGPFQPRMPIQPDPYGGDPISMPGMPPDTSISMPGSSPESPISMPSMPPPTFEGTQTLQSPYQPPAQQTMVQPTNMPSLIPLGGGQYIDPNTGQIHGMGNYGAPRGSFGAS